MTTVTINAEEFSLQKLQEFIDNDTDFVHYLGMIEPPLPGMMLCLTQVHNYNFPDTQGFKFGFINWEDVLWALVSIPKKYMDLVKKIAADNDLIIDSRLPEMIIDNKKIPFPIKSNERMFALITDLEVMKKVFKGQRKIEPKENKYDFG